MLASSVPAATDLDGSVASYALVSGPGPGNGTLLFNANGSYSFAPGSDFDALAAGATRQVSFTYTASGLTVQFANRTKNAVTWTWSFGDGTTSTARNPAHTYASAGSYPVSLTATSLDGVSARSSGTVTVAE